MADGLSFGERARWSGQSDWADMSSDLAQLVRHISEEHLDVYRRSPLRVQEDSGAERAITEGGYGHRQLFELVQNAADAIRRAYPALPLGMGGRIEVVLTAQALYCANEGEPIQPDGVESILFAHMSNKRGDEIGHFGLGFKSVLAITRNPQFFSRTGSFGFDVEGAARRIREVVPEVGSTPGLRLADPLDPSVEARADSTLQRLMAWAASVVKLPRDGNRAALLSQDMANFPRDFLLFSGHVGSLILADETTGVRRAITTRVSEDGITMIEENGEQMRWRVFKTNHEPGPEARIDGGTIAGRETVPVAWAVPLDQRMPRGQFWAFFPTAYTCLLSGIVNAAWKTNADRQNLLEGSYNQELLDVAARLVAANLQCLARQEDPGFILDVLPARDTQLWADELLAERIYTHLESVPCLPDSSGTPRVPSSLSLLPAGLTEEAVEFWKNMEGQPPEWAHWSASSRERRPRAARLGACDSKSVSDWLGEVARPATSESSINAILLAGRILPRGASFPREHPARKSAIVLTKHGELLAPGSDGLYLAGDYVSTTSAEALVHPDVQADAEAVAVLQRLGLTQLDPLEEVRRMVGRCSEVGFDWVRFWSLVRSIDPTQANLLELLREHRFKLKCRNEAGDFLLSYELLLPGAVALSGVDTSVALDISFHEEELDLIRSVLGIQPGPHSGGATRLEPWFSGYEREQRQRYFRELNGPVQPQAGYINITSRRIETTGPLTPLLSDASEEFKSRFTTSAAALAAQDPTLSMGHDTVRTYPLMTCEPPAHSVLRRHGVLPTSLGPLPVAECVGSAFEAWGRILPCTTVCATFLNIPNQVSELSDDVVELAYTRALTDHDSLTGSFYGAVASATTPWGSPRFAPPNHLRCRVGDEFDTRPPADVAVIGDDRMLELLGADRVPAVLCPDQEGQTALVTRWGLRPLSDVATTAHGWSEGRLPLDLADLFPGLPSRVLDEYGALACVACGAVWVETLTAAGSYRLDVDLYRAEDQLYYVSDLEPSDLLSGLARELGLSLSETEFRGALDYLQQQLASELVDRIRSTATLEGRIAVAVGEGALRRQIPAHVLDVVERNGTITDPQQLATIALSVHDVALLGRVQDELERRGLDAPRRWRGSARAVDFVRSLDLPDEFAGLAAVDDPPWLEVDGPTRLNGLHDFQRKVADNIREMLTTTREGRGLLSLPTGAGKTRVLSETLVLAYAGGVVQGPILWIADRQELCDQAVQSWREVWQAYGPQHQRLRISRFWGRTNGSLANLGDRPHLVVATYQTMGRRLERQYDWLAQAQVIIVDEAHGSIAPTYTEILAWLGLDQRRTERILIGLTATPFRGRRHDDEETRRLVGRYGSRRFDFGVFADDDPYPFLQRMGVLSQVDHEVLDGARVTLTPSEMEQLRQYRVLPRTAENRLGSDPARNEVLLRKLCELDPLWPVVVFATSVAHAELMAALLALNGISARAISGNTDPWARRHSIEAFRKGEVRVLVNYGVLTTGFDAPETRAIVVARPVYSPGLYQQMIGRGLRGPLNGGTDRCLIINVEDNVHQYGEELAFRHFEHLWRKSGLHSGP